MNTKNKIIIKIQKRNPITKDMVTNNLYRSKTFTNKKKVIDKFDYRKYKE